MAASIADQMEALQRQRYSLRKALAATSEPERQRLLKEQLATIEEAWKPLHLSACVVSPQDVSERFVEFDKVFFGGQLTGKTSAILEGNLGPLDISGYTDPQGTQVAVNGTEECWEGSLIHEMVHAFEIRFPDQISPSEESTVMERLYSTSILASIHQPHSSLFFAKLFEIMAARSHDKKRDFHVYFG